MNNVLIPIDGSKNSLRAVRHVIEHVRQHGPCSIHLLNVQRSVASATVLAVIAGEAIDQYYESQAGAALADAKAALDDAGLPYEAALRVGSVAEAIEAYAAERQCDHIVMGTRGLDAVGSLLGSVALKVLHKVRIPVTLVN